eukprot:13956961-Ditylum_brightwellii.AAC.1
MALVNNNMKEFKQTVMYEIKTLKPTLQEPESPGHSSNQKATVTAMSPAHLVNPGRFGGNYQ